MKDFKKEIEDRSARGLLRTLPQGLRSVDFLSNDYLGLAKNAIQFKGPNGSSGSRMLSGNNQEIETLEGSIAKFHNSPSSLLFNSGYSANLGLISAVASRTDVLIMDELCHASIIDGAVLSHAKRVKFKHQNLTELESKLTSIEGNKFVVTEGIFSMDGSETNVREVLSLCEKYDAILILDEAHSAGVKGDSGQGLGAEFGAKFSDRLIRVITYGKAFGSHGAAVLCADEVKSYLMNFARSFIYSTAMAPHQVHSIAHSYKQVKNADKAREQLNFIIEYWIKNRPANLCWLESSTQIQGLVVEGNDEVIKLARELRDADFSVLPIRYPTVKEGTERIRFCLHSYNTTEQIDQLFVNLPS